jgi:hypothetical protein
MPKRRTKIRRSRSRRYRKTRRNYCKGGNGMDVKCCMCERMVDKKNTLIPRECLMKYGQNEAHRICQDCWWDPTIGFARENASHRCPGCQKGLPLTEYKKEAPILVDLTEE